MLESAFFLATPPLFCFLRLWGLIRYKAKRDGGPPNDFVAVVPFERAFDDFQI